MSNEFSPATGARPSEGGVEFCTWAPHAESVAVTGDFAEWSAEGRALEKEETGLWRGHVPETGAGTQYKYVIKTNGSELWKNDPAARAMTNSAGNSVVVDDSTFDWGNDDAFTMPAWNELVIYELHLGTFFRGEDKDTPGNFDNAIERLDHLVNLGINAIELMPVAEFAGGQSWGYNPAFPFAVESDYGGPDGLKRFVKACHEKGICVLVDVVYNHFGPSDLDMWQFDGWSENGKGGIYFYNDHRSKTPWGDTRPDYGRKEVRQYIRDNALMWMECYHADGLRFDMTFYMRSSDDGADIPDGWSLAQWINDEVNRSHPGALTIAEDLRSNDWITKPTSEGGAGFGTQWDEQFVHPVRSVLTVQDDGDRSMATIASALCYAYNGDPMQRVVYTESHDEVANGKSRVPTEVDDYEQEGYWARKRSALGACLTMTAPGIPMIFQGQELLETGHFEDAVELDWEKGYRHPGLVRIYRDLIQLRTNRGGQSSALQTSQIDIRHINDNDKVLVYTRGEGGEEILVVANFSQRKWDGYRVPITQPGRWKLLFRLDATVYGDDFGDTHQGDVEPEEVPGDGCPWSAEIALGSYDFLVLRRDG